MENQAIQWTLAQRVAFRFCTVFFLLNMFPFPANMYPDEMYMDGLTYLIWKQPVQWIATHLLGIPGEISTQVTGSGDTTFHWILFGLTIFLSLIAALLWSVIDRRRLHYQRAMAWLRVYTRYYLAYMLFIYGIIKIYHLQMPTPALYRLAEPYGNFSPMGVLWSFIGVSKAYSAFSGWAEVLGGALLLFRRTTLLGALVSFAVMVHVFVLNMCYDVPVKLFSFFLVLACIFLIVPELGRLAKFFFLQQPTFSVLEKPLFIQRKWNIAAIVLKFGVIGWMLYSNISGCIEGQKEYGDRSMPAPLAGIYKVQSFERNGAVVPPLLTDSTLWNKLLVHNYPEGWGRITMANEKLAYCTFKVDSVAHQIDLHPVRDTLPNLFAYEQPDSNSLVIRGLWKNDSLTVRLNRTDREYRLLKWGYNWVNEYPVNQ
jgi:hypothetical protein